MSHTAAHLNLWKHDLGHVPESIWEQADLATLVLADNGLNQISSAVSRLRRLRTLDLGHNALTFLQESLGELDNLTDFLYLHDHRLSSLPSSLGRLKRLRYLNISENDAFESLPECICEMHGLIELRVSDNPLTTLPDSVCQLKLLRELNFRNTNLKYLPDTIGQLVELRQIDLRGTQLQHLPSVLAGLPRLEKLDLRWVTDFERPSWLTDLEERGCVVYS